MGGLGIILEKTVKVFQEEGLKGLRQRFKNLKADASLGLTSQPVWPMKFNALPDIADIMHSEGPDCLKARLHAILSKDRETVCIIGHHLGGGAEDYADQRRGRLLASGNAVLSVKYCAQQNRIAACAEAGGERLLFTLNDPEKLTGPGFPRIHRFIINTLVSWRLGSKPGQSTGAATSPYADLPLLLTAFQHLAEHHQAAYEVAWHEHYPICPNYTLLNQDSAFCDLPEDGKVCCSCLAHCTPPFDNPDPASVRQWRSAWAGFLCRAEKILCFSRSSVALVKRVFNPAPGKIMFLPHDPLIDLYGQTYRPPGDEPMTVAVIGAIGPQKGSRLVGELASALANNEKLVLIGTINDRNLLPPDVVVTGPYRREHLPDLLASHRVTVGFISSVWPETFNYVTQECMALGLPLVCLPIGACRERIAEWDYGLVAPEVSARSALDTLRKLDARRRESGTRTVKETGADGVCLDAVLPDFIVSGPSLKALAVPDEPGVDILLTVHNSFDFLVPCLESVLTNTDLPFRLFLNDDASDDPRVMDYLSEIKKRLPSTYIHRNETLRGFPASMDALMRVSDRDVIMVNADTVMPPGWASRLLWPLRHSGVPVASATPLSNSGTSTAFPYLNRDSEIFEGLPLETMDKVCRSVRPEAWREMPTGVGFCMAVSRKALHEIGAYDVETFSPGYGDEVDWCRRAAAFGYRHALTLNLFVYHKHGGSYKRILSEERRNLLDSHNRIIERRYPDYVGRIHKFFSDPYYLAQRTILLFLSIAEAGRAYAVYFTSGKNDDYPSHDKTASFCLPTVFIRPQVSEFELSFRYKEYNGKIKSAGLKSVASLLDFIKIASIVIDSSFAAACSQEDYAYIKKFSAKHNLR
jgi:GT2 family glycosyltransferase/glycosyltransferase involved in cell wall biosynthesis